MDLKSVIRTVPNYPKPGIQFRDITPLLKKSVAFRYCVDRFAQRYQSTALDAVVAIESRGFFFGSVLAYQLGVPLIPIRKKGKLPSDTISTEYDLEYGVNTLEMHVDALAKAEQIVIIDDLIATGGTIKAAIQLVRNLGGNPTEVAVVIELSDLGGRSRISPLPLFSLVSYHEYE